MNGAAASTTCSLPLSRFRRRVLSRLFRRLRQQDTALRARGGRVETFYRFHQQQAPLRGPNQFSNPFERIRRPQ
mgnify:FL=1